ncbi:MarR family transcriptional regulator [Streptomyces spinoverrucosus]|uniref:MarR family transcriptional regulator n=1 Tax=Streptomyces spinoverrucosus TaxID=284043 RepID=A0A4Y3V8N2_9ACTN|nr:MarR family transcriptional regulator [Streptomyces spinoverrucosus]GEC03204.1 MarR family transcriptional regulator [Streptomyces spinoverrucosus]GHB37425.1 MarR family transcriptional regulator [Streptomyces spinoverrucosus]
MSSQNDAQGAPAPLSHEQDEDDEIVTWWGLVIEGYHATHNGLMDEIADRTGLAPNSFDILIRLLRSPECRLPMTRLAKEAALSSGGFTKVADRLVAAGLIRREPCDTDRRVTYAALTDRGLVTAKEARKVCAQSLRTRLLDPLGHERALMLAEVMRTLRAVNRTD